ncbi:hypothetical protein CO151_06890 [bacterium CG_4_9_14_3_um_filter_65_15]|nr:MAG: hypothetical protein CO151_06890 [bacterium CG_4_9_14_3_um_filter_65_15]
MQIDKPSAAEHAEFLRLVDAEIRPDRAKTHAWEDFPLILHDSNRDSVLIARDETGRIAGGIAGLIREFSSDYGPVAVAGIGSVVTHPDFRGRGISRRLQENLLAEFAPRSVPLAVLWTDQPEIYAGRGFHAAGWEFHLNIQDADLPTALGSEKRIRPLQGSDVGAVSRLYDQHPCRTLRRPGDAEALYMMPGTRGLVLEGAAGVEAVVFCGKGADFPGYIGEWDGDASGVLMLLEHARRENLAHNILVPAGEEVFAETLVKSGAGWAVRTSGFWRVLDQAGLSRLCGVAVLSADEAHPPTYWLGDVNDQGGIRPGILKIGVWGFDSV